MKEADLHKSYTMQQLIDIMDKIELLYDHYKEIFSIIKDTIIQSFLWLVLLYLTMRYYQTTIHIEKQYNCIYSIKSDISSIGQIKFDRESGNYLSNYPKMSDFVDLLYKWVFPIIYCLIICYKIITEYITSKFSLLLVLNTVLFISCFVLTILYLVFLNSKKMIQTQTINVFVCYLCIGENKYDKKIQCIYKFNL